MISCATALRRGRKGVYVDYEVMDLDMREGSFGQLLVCLARVRGYLVGGVLGLVCLRIRMNDGLTGWNGQQ